MTVYIQYPVEWGDKTWMVPVAYTREDPKEVHRLLLTFEEVGWVDVRRVKGNGHYSIISGQFLDDMTRLRFIAGLSNVHLRYNNNPMVALDAPPWCDVGMVWMGKPVITHDK